MSQLVSVIIPTYNRSGPLARAIASAASQTHAELEIVVVDDGSTDDTRDVVERLCAADARVVYLRQENRGVAGARNTGLRAARGDYLALLDSDDVWKHWKVELQLRCLAAFPEAGMIWTDMEAWAPDGRLVSPRYLRTMYKRGYRWFPTPASLFSRSRPLADLSPTLPFGENAGRVWCGDLGSAMIMGNLVHTSTVLLRRERFEKVGGFDEALRISGEDFDFHLRTCRAGPVAFADVASIRYQWGGADQLTRPELRIHMASNFWKTIQPILAGDRDLGLPPAMLAAVRAEAHAWIGRESLAHGDRRAAREHLRESLRHQALRPGTLALYALAFGPRFGYPAARALVRAAKRAARVFGFGLG